MSKVSYPVALLASLLILGGAACGGDDDDGGSDVDGGGTQADARPVSDSGGGGPDAAGPDDAGTGRDAGEPDAAGPLNPIVWVHGDMITNNRNQLAGYTIGSPVPATPVALFPPGDIGQLGSVESQDRATYDISPVSQLVAFPAAIDTPGHVDLYTASTDGSGVTPHVIVGPTANVGKARFSPNGQLIAFTADLDTDGLFGAYVVPADTPGAVPVRVSPADAPGDVDDVLWSRDSTSVLTTVDSDDTNAFELWITDVTVATPVPTLLVPRDSILATATPRGVIRPIVAASGRVLFRGRLEVDNIFRLHVVDLDGNISVLQGSEITRADQSIADVGAVGSSPNGNQIAFAADEVLGTVDVWVLPIQGAAAATRLTTGLVAPKGETINPDQSQLLKWRPDGQAIAFIADYATPTKDEPFVVSLDGSGPRRLAIIGPADAAADAEAVAWSPDGAQLFVVADHQVPNDTELFALDPALTDQEPTLVVDVTPGGDLRTDIKVSD